MADTGEDREIRRRANANEAEAIRESKKLAEKAKPRSAKMDAPQQGKKKRSVQVSKLRSTFAIAAFS